MKNLTKRQKITLIVLICGMVVGIILLDFARQKYSDLEVTVFLMAFLLVASVAQAIISSKQKK